MPSHDSAAADVDASSVDAVGPVDDPWGAVKSRMRADADAEWRHVRSTPRTTPDPSEAVYHRSTTRKHRASSLYHHDWHKVHYGRVTAELEEKEMDMDEAAHVTMTDFDENLVDFEDAERAASVAVDAMQGSLAKRLEGLFRDTETAECRRLIAEHFSYFVGALGEEAAMPYHDHTFTNTCDEENKNDNDTFKKQNTTYQSDDPDDYISADELSLLYLVLTHEKPAETIRLIAALHVPGLTQFVIHVDAKSADTHAALLHHYAHEPHVHILPHPHRVRVNWGSYSMVEATLRCLRYAYGHMPDLLPAPLSFHKAIHLSSTTYPLVGNAELRATLASYPLDANFLEVRMKRNVPDPDVWNYFVECDDKVHRIYRVPPPAGKDVGLYTSSQWWIISREFGAYLAAAEGGSFVRQFLDYAEHIVVADEHFFGTVLRNTEFCAKHHNNNFLHVQFDQWEDELSNDKNGRDGKKCLMPSPDHCGRSPVTMTKDYLPVLELSGALFARKFDDDVDTEIKDILDARRSLSEEKIISSRRTEPTNASSPPDIPDLFPKISLYEEHGTLFVAQETVSDPVPLCLGLGEIRNIVRLVPCFVEGVVQTLAEGWETGAVIREETQEKTRWSIGPCSTDGRIARGPDGRMTTAPGIFSPNGPLCHLKQMDGLRAGRCLDVDNGEADMLKPGGKVLVYPCVSRWNQYPSFGQGELEGALHVNVPSRVLRSIERTGKTLHKHLCLGVRGRSWEEGVAKEDQWGNEGSTHESEEEEQEYYPILEDDELYDEGIVPLSKYIGQRIYAEECSFKSDVIKWIAVPFIIEDTEENNNSTVVKNNDHNDEERVDESKKGSSDKSETEL